MFSFDAIKNGIVITGTSISFMFKRPTLLLFGLIRLILFTSLYIGSFITLFFLLKRAPDWAEQNPTAIIILISFFAVLIYCTVLLSLFVSVATIDYLLALYNQQPRSMLRSFGIAFKRLPVLFVWSGFYCGVGTIISLIRGDSQRSSTWRKMIGEGLAFSWQLATFFVTPFIAEKNLSIGRTLKESAQLVKKAFGEVVGMDVSFNAISSFIFPIIPLTVFWIVNRYFYPMYDKAAQATTEKSPHALLALTALFLIPLALRILISTAQNIFKAAVFNYAHGKSSGPIAPERIRESFVKKQTV